MDSKFKTSFTGLAWVLGQDSTWERALASERGDVSALDAFSQSIGARLPDGGHLPSDSAKYHVLDVWNYCRGAGLDGEIVLDVPHADPVLELLRSDAKWLLEQSGLAVLAVGGDLADANASGLGRSGDGLRERARAFAALMMVAIPFLPGGDQMLLLPEGRTEDAISDAARFNLFSEKVSDTRLSEPFRNFVGHLNDDLMRASARCKALVSSGEVISSFRCEPRRRIESFLANGRHPVMSGNAARAVKAMKGIADLAAALIMRPDGTRCRLVVPEDMTGNSWIGNYRQLREAIND